MNIKRYVSYNAKTGLFLLVFLIFLSMLLAGHSLFSKPEKNNKSLVSKPNEIYVARNGSLTRIDNESKWFDRFLQLAESAAEADTGSNVSTNTPSVDVSGMGFLRGYDPKFLPNIVGFKRLKPGESKEFPKEKSFVLFLYYAPAKLVIANDKTAENHYSEVVSLGFPINTGGVHWVRYIMLELDTIQQDYNLFVEGTYPYYNRNTQLEEIGTGYHRQFVNRNKFDLDQQLESALNSFRGWWPW